MGKGWRATVGAQAPPPPSPNPLSLAPLSIPTQGLARCEALARLDLSANFIRPGRLRRSVAALARAPALAHLWLVGNPCGRVWRGGGGEETGCSPSSTHVPLSLGPWCPTASTDAAAASACRAYVVARLPLLATLDGTPIKASERAAAVGAVEGLEAGLAAAEAADGLIPPPYPPPPASASSGVDAAEMMAMEAEVDSLLALQAAEQEAAGRGVPLPPRPWTRAARLAEARAGEGRAAAKAAAAAAAASAAAAAEPGGAWPRPGRHTAFPPLADEDGGGAGSAPPPPIRQANEGGWRYSLTPTPDGDGASPPPSAIVLDLALGKGVPPGDVRVDVTPGAVRVLVASRCVGLGGGGRGLTASALPPLPTPSASASASAPPCLLLQLALPARVCPPASTAARSRASGALVVTMPLVEPGAALDPACMREKDGRGGGPGAVLAPPVAAPAAAVVMVAPGGGDDAPPLAG